MNGQPEKPRKVELGYSMNLPDIDPKVASELDDFAKRTLAGFASEPYVALPATTWTGIGLTEAIKKAMEQPGHYSREHMYGMCNEWLERRGRPKTSDSLN